MIKSYFRELAGRGRYTERQEKIDDSQFSQNRVKKLTKVASKIVKACASVKGKWQNIEWVLSWR